MGSRGALGEPATVLSPSLVTSVAHPCPPSSHKDGQHGLRHGWELGEALMDLGRGGGAKKGGSLQTMQEGVRRHWVLQHPRSLAPASPQASLCPG